MEFELSLKIVARCPTTGAAVELCPGGLVEAHSDVGTLMSHVRGMTGNYFEAYWEEQYCEYLRDVQVEAEVLARMAGSLPPRKAESRADVARRGAAAARKGCRTEG